MSIHRTIGLVLCAAVLASCSTPAPSGDTVLQKEQSAVAALKPKYKEIVMGTDVKDRTLILYVDVDKLYSMDEDAEDAMKTDALNRWKAVWASAHPHKHGTVHLSLRDYYGKEIYAGSATV